MKRQVSLEQIFGSRIRVRLLRLFLEHPDQKFYVREITRCTRSHLNSVRRELANLTKVGLVHIFEDGLSPAARGNGLYRKYYAVNPSCVIFQELRALLIKGQLFLQEELKRHLASAGAIRYLALMGFFVDQAGAPTDLLLVGRMRKKKCEKLIRDFEEEFGRTINYTILSLKEYKDRKEMMDRFLYNLLEAKKLVLVDALPMGQRMGV